ncbi:uncharacterized protein ARMOST_18046 [Armillaria ostoyae]|uniref:Uncharacterized protein n=1 Tax=Armillaria ostoyae TaxID=47428 RepID=A0A284S0Q9_ARMOS|nr:uncharacterized protein ARMOST_18046 [Armillaria ostoyae]
MAPQIGRKAYSRRLPSLSMGKVKLATQMAVNIPPSVNHTATQHSSTRFQASKMLTPILIIPRLADGLYRSERTHYKIGLVDVEGGIANGGEQSAKKNVKVGYQNIPSLDAARRALSSVKPPERLRIQACQ